MAWTSPKTWSLNDTLPYTDLNTYVRDNLLYLYEGLQHVVEQWILKQSAAISLGAQNAWVNVNSNGLVVVEVGEVAGLDIVDFSAAARCSCGGGTNTWSVGVSIYDNTTLVARYTGAKADSSESQTIAGSHQFDQAYDEIKVYLSARTSGAYDGTLLYATAPDTYGWLNVTHKRPPA